MGGQERFWNLWVDDMVARQVEAVVYMLVANKADRFFDDKAALLWQQGRIGEHKVFDPFRDDLIRLQKANIRSKRSFMATRIGWNVEISMLDLLTS